MLQVVDDALYSAVEARNKTTRDADTNFEKATVALNSYEKKYHLRETVAYTMAEAAKDKSYLASVNRLKETLGVRKYLDLCYATY
jgi:hypothetical protein